MFPYFNQKAIAFNLSSGDPTLLTMLQALPVNELVVLQKNEDLLERCVEIADMDVRELAPLLRDEYSIELAEFGNGEMWADTGGLDDAVPEWMEGRTRHCGWYIETAKLLEFGQEFLMQEVRVNIYSRYLEHKSEKSGSDSGYGNYL